MPRAEQVRDSCQPSKPFELPGVVEATPRSCWQLPGFVGRPPGTLPGAACASQHFQAVLGGFPADSLAFDVFDSYGIARACFGQVRLLCRCPGGLGFNLNPFDRAHECEDPRTKDHR